MRICLGRRWLLAFMIGLNPPAYSDETDDWSISSGGSPDGTVSSEGCTECPAPVPTVVPTTPPPTDASWIPPSIQTGDRSSPALTYGLPGPRGPAPLEVKMCAPDPAPPEPNPYQLKDPLLTVKVIDVGKLAIAKGATTAELVEMFCMSTKGGIEVEVLPPFPYGPLGRTTMTDAPFEEAKFHAQVEKKVSCPGGKVTYVFGKFYPVAPKGKETLDPEFYEYYTKLSAAALADVKKVNAEAHALLQERNEEVKWHEGIHACIMERQIKKHLAKVNAPSVPKGEFADEDAALQAALKLYQADFKAIHDVNIERNTEFHADLKALVAVSLRDVPGFKGVVCSVNRKAARAAMTKKFCP